MYRTADLVKSRFPFREWGWGISMVTGYLEDCGVEIPERTDCAKCYHQRIGEWFALWRDYPERFFAAAEQEARIGHTFRSPGRDTWPVALIDLAEAFASGRTMGRNIKPQGNLCRVCSL